MKKALATMFFLVLSVVLALVCFDLLVYLGLSVAWLHTAIQMYPGVILAVLLLVWLRVLFIGKTQKRYAKIEQMTIVQGPEGVSVDQLKDEKTFQLEKDHKTERIRQYRNIINGELVLASYEKPRLLKQKGRRLKWVVSVLVIVLLLGPGMIIPQINAWNQQMGDALRMARSDAMSYIGEGNGDVTLRGSADGYWQELRQKWEQWLGDFDPTALFGFFGRDDSDQYVLPESDTRELTEDDVAGMDRDTIQLAINEIYARRGYAFSNDSESARAAREYFSQKDWYEPTIESMEETQATFSDIERKNINFLVEHRD